MSVRRIVDLRSDSATHGDRFRPVIIASTIGAVLLLMVLSLAAVVFARITRNSSDALEVVLCPEPELDIEKASSAELVSVSDTLRYTVKYRNSGDAVATNVRLTDTLPLSMTYEPPASPLPAYYITSTNQLIWSLPSLDPTGEWKTIVVTVTVDPSAQGQELQNRVDLRSAETSASDSVSITVRPTTTTILALEKSAQPAVVRVGERLTYALWYSNTGSVAANNVVITDTLPPSVTVAYLSRPPDSMSDPHTLLWRLGELGADGVSRTITAVVTVGNTLTNGQWLTNTATIIAENASSTTTWTATEVTWFSVYLPIVMKHYPPMPDFSTSRKTVAWQVYDSQFVLAYTISLANTGHLPAADVRLTDTIPVSTTYVSGSVAPTTACQYRTIRNQGQIVCNNLTVGVSETSTVSFRLSIDGGAFCLVDNEAFVDDGFHRPFTLTAKITSLPRILNGGFEADDLTCWQRGGRMDVGVVVKTWKNGPCMAGHCVQLGGDDKRYEGDQVPIGYGAIWQTFQVPATSLVSKPEISLVYRVFSHDRVYDPEKGWYRDDFEISVDEPPKDDWDDENEKIGCNIRQSYPETMTITVTRPGLVLCGGNRTVHIPDGYMDTGWLTVTLRLDPHSFSGRDVTLYLANWNRHTPFRNTWTYVLPFRLKRMGLTGIYRELCI